MVRHIYFKTPVIKFYKRIEGSIGEVNAKWADWQTKKWAENEKGRERWEKKNPKNYEIERQGEN